METNPYNSPISFDYKPLGLEAFAEPLSKMQDRYDKLNEEASKMTYDINALSVDEPRSQEVIKNLNDKRDEVVGLLQSTKNYRQASQKLAELNRIYNTHPEIQELNARSKQLSEFAKEQKEKVDKGHITQDEANKNISNVISDYTNRKGLQWNPSDGSSNNLGLKHLSNSQAEAIRKDATELAKAAPSDLYNIGIKRGIDMSKFIITNEHGSKEVKDAEGLRKELREHLLAQPDYMNYLNERSNLNLDYQKYNDPDTYKNIIHGAAVDRVHQMDSYINQLSNKKNRTEKETEDLQKLVNSRNELDNSIQSGNIDEDSIRSNIHNEYARNYMDEQARTAANLFDLKRIKMEYGDHNVSSIWANANGYGNGSGSGNKPVINDGLFVPNIEQPFNIPTLKNQITTNQGTLRDIVKTTNNIAGNAMRTLVLGKQGTASRAELEKHPDKIYENQYKVMNAFTRGSSSFDEFNKELKKLGVQVDGVAARKVFNELKTNPMAVSQFKEGLDNGSIHYKNVSDSKSTLDQQRKNVESTQDWKNVEQTIASYKPDILVGSSSEDVLTPEESRQKAMYNMASYTPEQLKKAGVTFNKNYKTDKHYNTLTIGQVVKLKGYNSISDAHNKGFDFGGVVIPANNEGVAPISGDWKKIGDHLDVIKQNINEKNLNKQQMSFRYVNDPKLNKALTRTVAVMGITDLSSFDPAFAPNWNDQLGFDDTGHALPGTVLNVGGDRQVHLVTHGNNMYYELPIKTKEGKQGTVVVKPKNGTNPFGKEVLDRIDVSSQTGSDVDNQVSQMVKKDKFNLRYSNSLSPQYVESIPVNKQDKEAVLLTVPYDDSDIHIVKQYTGEGLEPVLKVKVGNEYITDDSGKEFYTKDPDAAKAFIAKQLGF